MTPRLLCPVCGGELARHEHTFVCEMGHSYDIAAAGYCNLLRPGKLRNRVSGDDREMVAARGAFLRAGYYAPVLDYVKTAVSSLINGKNAALTDAGCGEGFYTNGVALFCPTLSVLGIDISKHAVLAAAKDAKRSGISDRALYIAASSASMPIGDLSTDIVLSLFSPCAYGEFARVTAEGGRILIGSAGINHLWELKEILYGKDNVRPNVPIDHAAAASPFGLRVEKRETVSFTVTVVGREHIAALFSMTPYRWRTPKEGALALSKLESLTTTAEIDLTLLTK